MSSKVKHAFGIAGNQPAGAAIAAGESRDEQSQPVLPLGLRALHAGSRPWRTVGILIASDLFWLALVNALTVWVRYILGGKYHPSLYWQLWPVIGFFILAYAAVGLYSGVALYPGVALGPIKELKRASLATTWVYLTLAMATFFLRSAETYSRSIFLLGWAASLVAVPLGRVIVRHFLARCEWWGHPVVVLGAGETARLVISTLQRHPILGLKVVAALDDDPQKHGKLCGVPVIGRLELAPVLAREFDIQYAIVAMPGVPGHELQELFQRHGKGFPHLLIIPELVGFSSMWVEAKDLGGVLGLEVRQNLLLKGPQLTKRVFDVVVTAFGGVLLLPVIGLIALLIKLETRGPALYTQKRLGKSGQRFKAWKFRTMFIDSDRVLARYLDVHPEFRDEWMRTQKLKNDPRVTRVGRLLRKTSLDELPQIWNVFKGEMSLVGPRPIISEEIPRYGDKFGLYCKVLPGLTGLWQVSGRNNVPYEERVKLDAYYVSNWSVWFDIYILARTIRVVLFGDGAY